jgi:hypothetical protein
MITPPEVPVTAEAGPWPHPEQQQQQQASQPRVAGRLTPAQAELVAGCVAGATNVISGYPFDTLKVRLQASPGQYAGMRDCFWKLWRTEGVSAATCACLTESAVARG